ncbi:bacillithiol system redox-active protein YtxJ [Psychroflexus sp. ALD_RP9]|uniref:bacillithiol system redox-active protein YtxJ n=1 Tax=Psychroflexus sp. ALD_RP9 TaxID=2777186 RepID=UPI001A8DFD41|nr:bacillithiol system redox-active protein YtxJ [Psychroflexus sp. ALD_RP9]QSS97014.1 bacillithiol system redox-active protein YtxJ [Psychroflexus sp. ALD_RP9]
MGFFEKIFKNENNQMLDHSFENLNQEKNVEHLLEESKKNFVFIFKHSPRCGISNMVLNQFKQQIPSKTNAKFYLLNVIQNRDLSSQLAKDLNVVHESPQLIILKDEKVLSESSHSAINRINLDEFES